MKGLFKLTTAALALLTMASCSQDDLLSNKQGIQAPQKGELQVVLEDLIDPVTTRAAFVPESNTKNTVYWQTTDYIEVFDEAMVKYDIYQFNKKQASFVNIDEETTRVGAPKYALFGGGDVEYISTEPCYITGFGYDYGTNATTAEFNIPLTDTTISPYVPSFTFGEDADIAGGTIAYQSFLPMWGDAAKDGDGVKVSMHYLTAVLRVYLKNAKSNITDFMVKAYEDQACTKPLFITGPATAVISEADEANADAYLIPTSTGTANDGQENAITVGGIENASGDAYLYVPLFAQYYGALKFYISTDNGTNWTLIKTTKPMTLERQKVYRLTLESFKVAGDDLESINATLVSQKDATADVNINTEQPTDVTAADDVLVIPAGMKANITLNLQGLSTSDSTPLEIESEDGKYEGTLIVDASAATTPSSLANIFINLPKANVVFIGDFSATSFGQYSGGAFVDDKLIVKSLTFSNGEATSTVTKAKNVFPNKESTGDITVGELAQVAGISLQGGGANVEEIIVNGSVTGNVRANNADDIISEITVGEKGSIYGVASANGDITIEGAVTGAVTSAEGNITIGDKATYGAALTASKGAVAISTEKAIPDAKITAKTLALSGKADLTTITTAANAPVVDALTIEGEAKAKDITINDNGTATINVDARDGVCEAITGTLSVGKKVAINLTQGYVKGIDNTSAGSAAADAPTLTFGEGFTALTTVNTANIKPSASKWNGKTIPAAAAATYCTGDVWTACQLATVDKYAAATRLMNDIDLNSAAWTMPALTQNLVGFDKKLYALGLDKTTYPTITGLKATAKDDKGTGLFSTAKGTIQNFTVDGAEITSDKGNVGVLIGKTSGDATIDNITINNSSVAATGKSDNIGGLIGDIPGTHTVAIGNTGKPVNVLLTKLQGRYNLGGLIGRVAGGTTTITVTKTEIAAIEVNGAITALPSVGTPSDPNAGAIGMYVGLIGPAAGTPQVNIDAANKGTNYIEGHRVALGFLANFVDNTHVYYGMKNANVGQCAYNLYIGGVAQMGDSKKDNVAAVSENGVNAYVKVGAADYK